MGEEIHASQVSMPREGTEEVAHLKAMMLYWSKLQQVPYVDV